MADADIKLKIKQAIVEGLKLKHQPESIRDDEKFFGGGLNLDSVDVLTLVVVLEDKFGVKIKDNEVEKLNSVNAVADFLAGRPA